MGNGINGMAPWRTNPIRPFSLSLAVYPYAVGYQALNDAMSPEELVAYQLIFLPHASILTEKMAKVLESLL